MRFGNIKNNDTANGEGVRVTLFVSGCTHHCDGCFQPETWSFEFGREFDRETEDSLIEMGKAPYITGFTLLGGEPFEPENRPALVSFVKRAKEETGKGFWAYSGYTFEQLAGLEPARCGNATDLLSEIDVLVDGEFKKDLKDISLWFRGSSNQRVLDVKESLAQAKAVPHLI